MEQYTSDEAYTTSVSKIKRKPNAIDNYCKHINAVMQDAEDEAERTLIKWVSGYERDLVTELTSEWLKNAIIDHADIILVFVLEEDGFPYAGDGSIHDSFQDIQRRVRERGLYYSHAVVKPVIITKRECPNLTKEQARGKFGEYPSDEAQEAIGRELESLLLPFASGTDRSEEHTSTTLFRSAD